MGPDWLGNLAEETLVSNKREVPLFWSSNGGCGGWRMVLELADLSNEPSPISHLRVLHLCFLLWLPAALLPSAEWAPHCPSALDIPSHSAGFVWTGLGVSRLPLAGGDPGHFRHGKLLCGVCWGRTRGSH